MIIGVMGAGAVGCYYGAMLAQAGHDVTVIARQHHVEVIAKAGLIFEREGQLMRVPVRASADPSALESASLILFCVKSNDTQTAGAEMAPYVRPEAHILSLQNGVDNATRLAEQLGRNVEPAVVYVAAEMAAAGHVRHHGRGELVLGPSPGNIELAEMFTAAAVPASISDNVIGALWAKLILNCAYNALSAISRQPYGQLVQAAGVNDVIRDVVEECLAVAAGLNIPIPGDIWAAVRQIAETMPTQFSSTSQDLARGKMTEIDYLNGYVVRRCEEIGVPAPANRVLRTLVKLLETPAL
jgi:2-dehydropantoate 2-reductase